MLSLSEGSKYLSRGLLYLLAASCALSACSTRPYTRPYSEIVRSSASEGTMLPSSEEEREKFFKSERLQQDKLLRLIQSRLNSESAEKGYRIGSGDELEINVFDVPELNLTTKVRESGFINLPLIGAVRAVNRTDTELLAELRGRLASFVRNPQVNLSVAQYGSQKVSVFGAVQKPGAYPLKKGANSVIELLGEAGGVTQRAGNYVNFVPAETSGGALDPATRARLALGSPEGNVRGSGIEIYLDRILGTAGGIPIEVPIRAGDMIIVPESGKVTVEGEVQKTGSYELGQQMSMLGALAAAGGLTYGAKVDEVEIIRSIGLDDKSRLIVDLTKVATGEERDVRLRNGDIVRVPSDNSRRFRQDTYETLGRVINFGVGGQVSVLP
jgi:polysaccharide export outer membrane protein